MMRKLATAALIAAGLSMSAFAQHPSAPGAPKARIVELKDGSTLHIYPDGKMAMHDKRNLPVTMKAGTKMVTKSGQVIMMRGNEVWRLIEPNDIGD